MKKDLLAVFFIVLAAVLVVKGTNIQSVDEYSLTHIDDITPDSETVFFPSAATRFYSIMTIWTKCFSRKSSSQLTA